MSTLRDGWHPIFQKDSQNQKGDDKQDYEHCYGAIKIQESIWTLKNSKTPVGNRSPFSISIWKREKKSDLFFFFTVVWWESVFYDLGFCSCCVIVWLELIVPNLMKHMWPFCMAMSSCLGFEYLASRLGILDQPKIW